MRSNPRVARRPARHESGANLIQRLALASVVLALSTGCLDTTAPVSPQCSPAMGIEVAAGSIEPGDEFTATATHPGDGCLSNLQWTGDGPITLRAAEGISATFRADDSGFATIRVQNGEGSLGVREIEIQEGEEGG